MTQDELLVLIDRAAAEAASKEYKEKMKGKEVEVVVDDKDRLAEGS